jgi:hypothetical protein
VEASVTFVALAIVPIKQIEDTIIYDESPNA